MSLISPTELSRRAGVSKQAVFDALDKGLIPFTLSGKKKKIDSEHTDVKSYITDNNRQREAVKKNDLPPEKRDEKPVKTDTRSKLRDGKPGKQRGASEKLDEYEGLDAHEIKKRKQYAEMRIKELDLEIGYKKFLPTEFIEDVYITYLEKFNSTVERFSATFIRDVGKKILESGEILPEHIEAFTNEILKLTHENKKQVWKKFKDYEPLH